MIFLISKSPWRCGDAFPEVSLMVQTKNKAKLDVIRFFLSPSSRPAVTMSWYSPHFYTPPFYKPNCFQLSVTTQDFFYSLFLSTVLLLAGMSFRCRDHASCRPVVTMICPHVPAYTWSVFSHFMCPPLYKPNCFPLSIATQAWSDSLILPYVYSLQE